MPIGPGRRNHVLPTGYMPVGRGHPLGNILAHGYFYALQQDVFRGRRLGSRRFFDAGDLGYQSDAVDDPAVKSGLLIFEIRPWMTAMEHD